MLAMSKLSSPLTGEDEGEGEKQSLWLRKG